MSNRRQKSLEVLKRVCRECMPRRDIDGFYHCEPFIVEHKAWNVRVQCCPNPWNGITKCLEECALRLYSALLAKYSEIGKEKDTVVRTVDMTNVGNNFKEQLKIIDFISDNFLKKVGSEEKDLVN